MTALRLVLVLGLVFHKAIWEVMKRRGGAPRMGRQPAPGLAKRAVKYGKVAALTFLLVQTLFLDLFPISEDLTPLRALGAGIYFLGLAVAVAGRLALGRNWANLEDSRVLPEQRLVRNGIYAYIRHPIYTGDILLLVGLELALNSWLVAGTLIPLLVIVRRVAVEETLLSRTFKGYEEYRQQTKRFIPFFL